MDQDHDNAGLVITHTDLTSDEAELLRLYRMADKRKKLAILSAAR